MFPRFTAGNTNKKEHESRFLTRQAAAGFISRVLELKDQFAHLTKARFKAKDLLRVEILYTLNLYCSFYFCLTKLYRLTDK